MKEDKEPPLQDDDLMPCGKYKGKRMDDVPEDYYIWLRLETVKDPLKFRKGKMSKVVAYMLRNIDRMNLRYAINTKKNMDWKHYFKK